MVNIAVLGYGTVGSGVVEVINTNHDIVNKRAGQEINVMSRHIHLSRNVFLRARVLQHQTRSSLQFMALNF